MHRLIGVIVLMIFVLTSCENTKIVKIYRQSQQDGILVTYYFMDNGTWAANNVTYKYRIEITGAMPNAKMESTFVYLSNSEDLTFEQAWKASGLSSFAEDYFSAGEAILVEMR